MEFKCASFFVNSKTYSKLFVEFLLSGYSAVSAEKLSLVPIKNNSLFFMKARGSS